MPLTYFLFQQIMSERACRLPPVSSLFYCLLFVHKHCLLSYSRVEIIYWLITPLRTTMRQVPVMFVMTVAHLILPIQPRARSP
jgi:hypothetical protein